MGLQSVQEFKLEIGFYNQSSVPQVQELNSHIFDKFRVKLRLGALLSPFQAGEQHLPAGLHEFLII